MNRKRVGGAVFVAGAGWAAAIVLAGCSQGGDPGRSETTSTTTDALNTVIACQTQEFGCATDAQAPTDVVSCQQQLQTCLLSLFPDAGALPPLPSLPSLDGGFPVQPRPVQPVLPDAGFPTLPTGPTLPTLPTLDAGFPGAPGLPAPIALPDGSVPANDVCLADLQSCLFAGTDPMTCASTGRTCLTSAAQAQCDAQEQACLAAGLPQAACDAQHQACP